MSQNSGLFYWFFSSGSFFLLTQAEKKGYQPVKSRSFCIGQQKKRTAILGYVNRLNVYLNHSFYLLVCLRVLCLHHFCSRSARNCWLAQFVILGLVITFMLIMFSFIFISIMQMLLMLV